MPVPKPHESEADFVARYMASEHAQRKWKDPKQRLRVAYEVSRKRKRRGQKGLSDYVYKLASNIMALDAPDFGNIEVNQSTMSAKGLLASTKRDRQGDILDVLGINTSEHRKNPVVLLDHAQSWAPPIGVTQTPTGEYTVSVDGDLGICTQETFFAQSGTIPEQIFHLITEGVLKGNSIGFRPLQWTQLAPDYSQGIQSSNKHIHSCEMIEASWTAVPANAECLAIYMTGKPIAGKKLDHCIKSMFAPYVEEQRSWSNGVTLEKKSVAQSATDETTGGALREDAGCDKKIKVKKKAAKPLSFRMGQTHPGTASQHLSPPKGTEGARASVPHLRAGGSPAEQAGAEARGDRQSRVGNVPLRGNERVLFSKLAQGKVPTSTNSYEGEQKGVLGGIGGSLAGSVAGAPLGPVGALAGGAIGGALGGRAEDQLTGRKGIHGRNIGANVGGHAGLRTGGIIGAGVGRAAQALGAEGGRRAGLFHGARIGHAVGSGAGAFIGDIAEEAAKETARSAARAAANKVAGKKPKGKKGLFGAAAGGGAGAGAGQAIGSALGAASGIPGASFVGGAAGGALGGHVGSRAGDKLTGEERKPPGILKIAAATALGGAAAAAGGHAARRGIQAYQNRKPLQAAAAPAASQRNDAHDLDARTAQQQSAPKPQQQPPAPVGKPVNVPAKRPFGFAQYRKSANGVRVTKGAAGAAVGHGVGAILGAGGGYAAGRRLSKHPHAGLIGAAIGGALGAHAGGGAGSMLENAGYASDRLRGPYNPKKRRTRKKDMDMDDEETKHENQVRPAMPTSIKGNAPMEDSPPEANASQEAATTVEPHSAQALRHLRFDLQHFHDTYHDVHGPICDTPAGDFIHKLKGNLQKTIEDLHGMWDKHYSDLEPLKENAAYDEEEQEGHEEHPDEDEDEEDASGKHYGQGEEDEEGYHEETEEMDRPRPTVPVLHEGDGPGHGEGEDEEEGYEEGAESTRYHKSFTSQEAERLNELHAFLEELHGQDSHPNSVRTAAKFHAEKMKDMFAQYQDAPAPNEGEGGANFAANAGTGTVHVGEDARVHHPGQAKNIKTKGRNRRGYKISPPKVRFKDAMAAEQDAPPPHDGHFADNAGEGTVHVGKSYTAEQLKEIEDLKRAVERQTATLAAVS